MVSPFTSKFTFLIHYIKSSASSLFGETSSGHTIVLKEQSTAKLSSARSVCIQSADMFC